MFQVLALIFSLSLFLGYLTQRYSDFQPSTTMIISSLILITCLYQADYGYGIYDSSAIIDSVKNIDFKSIILEGFLGYLLFAGALSVHFNDLKEQMIEIGILALISTLVSSVLIGYSIQYILYYFGHQIPLIYCLLFGALISPTDPIAVLATLKKAGGSKSLRTCIAGESLFNDGIGIVLFSALYFCLENVQPLSVSIITSLFFYKAVLGAIFGLFIGYIMFLTMNHKTNLTHIDSMMSIAIVTASYVIAEMIHISGALAMVSAGILFRYLLEEKSFVSSQRRNNLFLVWHVIDESLNLVLFFLIGFEVVHIFNFDHYIEIISLSIVLCLLTRLITVAIPFYFLRSWGRNTHPIKTITIGGLRGGLAIALALSLPDEVTYRPIILSLTYANVLFSLIVQSTLFTLITRKEKNL